MDDHEIEIFTIPEIEEILNFRFDDLNAVLENLEKKGFLSRIEKGKYCRANFRDEKVIGCFISGDGAIAYWSALNYHGLTEQFPNILFIQTSKMKRNKDIFGTTYKFVKTIPQKMTGIIQEGYGSRTYRITDVEKTMVDCFDYPQYSGGYAELIRGFSQTRLDSDKMITHCDAISNLAVTKRMGFLAELLKKDDLKPFVVYAKGKINLRYNVFDPLGIEKGEFVNEWRLRLNITREEILT